MNSGGLGLIKQTIAELEAKRIHVAPPKVPPNALSHLMRSLVGAAEESPAEIGRLHSALKFISSDTGRGHGSFFGANGHPDSDIWLAGVWAIKSLGWRSGKDIAKNWSQQCIARYTDQGFEDAWNGFNPSHPRHIGIGSLYKYATQLGWQNQPLPAATNNKYKLLTGNDLRALPPVQWRLKGILPYEGLAAMYGPSASGKSFLGFDAGVAISQGVDWFGIRTTKSTVVYVALEGESGFKNRVAAWELENGRSLPPDMFMVLQPFHITKPEDVDELAAAVPFGSVVIVDTLNRAAPTSDENSSKEMGEILESCKHLQALIGGLVVLIHHTGKDTSRGARGHSSFFAALDGAVEVERTATQRSWSVAKAKDGQDGKSVPFELKLHVLGVDADGDEITSCTITPVQGNIFAKPQPKGQRQQAALKAVERHIASLANPTLGIAGSPTGTVSLSFEDAVSHLSGTLHDKPKNKRNNEARRLLKALVDGSFVGTTIDANQDAWCWVV
ncbi:hypothetical protein MOLA814_00470 [Betaproteobacteria bacterium MOLA814]|nr:hypothetical protein MOLA814_00470 [Betaproteobacteria bacterium MOLA814]